MPKNTAVGKNAEVECLQCFFLQTKLSFGNVTCFFHVSISKSMYEGAIVPILSLIRQSLFLHHVTEQSEKSFSEIFPKQSKQKFIDVKEPQISIRNLKDVVTVVYLKTNKLQLHLVRLSRANHNSSMLLMIIVTMLGNCHWKPVRGYVLVRRRYIAAVSQQTWTHNSGVRIWKFCNRIGSEVFS